MKTWRAFSNVTFGYGVATLLCLGILVPQGLSQPPSYGQWPLEIGQRGFVPGAPFDISKFDSINGVNGNVVVTIPLASLPSGKGGSGLTLTLNYNSGMYDTVTNYVQDTNTTFHADTALGFLNAGTPWTYGLGYGLYMEHRNAQPVLISSGPQQLLTGGCVDDSPDVPDLQQSSQSALYPVRLMAQFPDGSNHVLVLTNNAAASTSEGWMAIDWLGFLSGCTGLPTGSFPYNYITQDGTFVRVSIKSAVGGSPVWVMTFPDGRMANGIGNLTQEIIDRNGNVISISGASSGCYPLQGDSSDPITVITDSSGRCIQIENGLPAVPGESSVDWISQAGPPATPNGPATLLVTSVSWNPKRVDFSYPYAGGGAGGCQIGYESECDPGNGIPPAQCAVQGTCAPAYAPMPMVGSVDLSKAGFNLNGTALSYSFGYNETIDALEYRVCLCFVTDVTLPHGQTTAWTAPTIHYVFYTPSVLDGQPLDGVTAKTLTHSDPYTGTSYTDSWQYNPAGREPGSNGGVQNPDGSITSYFFYPPGTSGPLDGHIFRTDKQDKNGNLLSRDEQMWAENLDLTGHPGPNVYLKADFHSVVPPSSTTPSMSAMRVYNVDVNGNVGEVDESDWVLYSTVSGLTHDTLGGIIQAPSLTSSSAARSTVSAYYVLADTTTNAANAYWSASAPVILNAKKSAEILGSGVATAYSEFVYDDATGSGGNPSGAGNVTQERRWDSTRASFPGATQSGNYSLMLSPSNAIYTNHTYYGGRLQSDTDPRGIQKQYTYPDPVYPYPTAVSQASGTSVEQDWKLTWDTNSGLLTSEIGPNNTPSAPIAAGYDPRGRMTSMNQAGLRLTNTTYNDAAQTVTVTRALDGSTNVVENTSTDDLGRAWMTTSTDGPSCTSTNQNSQPIQTLHLQQTPPGGGFSYQLTSNPFCTTADATMGWTRTKLDPLGRVVEEAHFSGSSLPAPWGSNASNSGVAQTTYSANQTTVSDEAGVSRTSTMDGLNRLLNVLDGTGVTTWYTYDALDNLTGVTQGAQQRSFVYTSLGRLKTATNPESGAVNYTWDDNGNLATRTDARGITTSMNTAPYQYL